MPDEAVTELPATNIDDSIFKVLLPFQPTPEQEAALQTIEAFLKDPKPGCISLTGVAGSGKTSLLRELSDRLPKMTSLSKTEGKLHGTGSAQQLVWSAMTGKAAQRLTQVTSKYARTLHGTLYQKPNVDFNQLSFTELQEPTCKILIVDEASMITPKIYEDLQSWVQDGVKIVLVGDFFQLPPIISKAEEGKWGQDFSVFSRIKGPMLTKVMRSDNEIVNVASFIRTRKFIPRESNGAYEFRIAPDPTQAAVDAYLDDPDDHALITWTNETRMEANRRIRIRHSLRTEIAKNEPILICRNGQGLLNGEIKKIIGVEPGPTIGPVQTLYMTFEGHPKPVLVSPKGKTFFDGLVPYIADRKAWGAYMGYLKKNDLPEPLPVTYGYTYTAHKCQGSEFRRVTVFLRREELVSYPFMRQTSLPNNEQVSFGVRLLYTALTRAKERVTFTLDK